MQKLLAARYPAAKRPPKGVTYYDDIRVHG